MDGTQTNSIFYNTSFAIRAAFLASLGVILTSLLTLEGVTESFGELPDGLISPIIAFEFAFDEQEVNTIFSDEQGINPSKVDVMRSLLYADFLFMACYSLLVVFLFLQSFSQETNKLFLLGVFLGFFMWAGDAWENILLLRILDGLPAGYQQHIDQLIWVTWLKWGTFPFAFALLVFAWRENKFLSRAMFVVAVASLVFSCVAIYKRSIANELVWLATILGFGLMIFYSVSQFINLRKSNLAMQN